MQQRFLKNMPPCQKQILNIQVKCFTQALKIEGIGKKLFYDKNGNEIIFAKFAENGYIEAFEDLPGGQDLIDDFLAGDNERISLQLNVDAEGSDAPAEAEKEDVPENAFFTETLANIYIKQGKYDKALEIIRRLCLEYPNKNRYFADQIRFLEKIVKHTKKNK